MPFDLSVALFHATVRISQPLPDGKFGQGTGFLISAPTPDGAPRVVLITANHVFADKMLGAEVKIGLRVQEPTGQWRYAPQGLRVRYGDTPLWTRHPQRDVAAIVVQLPPEAAAAAIPLNWLADADTFDRYGVGPGDAVLSLGYPIGLSSTPEGFPILRSGHIASYPLTPVARYPTFLLDSVIFSGNSGGPVFVGRGGRGSSQPTDDSQFIAGIVTQQVEHENRQMEIGVVTHAAFVRETIALLDQPPPTASPPALVAQPPP